jgi:hypothetical protein
MNKHAFTEQSHEMFYWIGFLMADGNVYIQRRFKKHGPTEKPSWDTRYKLSIGLQSRDKGHLEKFSRFMGCDPDKKVRYEQNNRAVRIEFESRDLIESVMHYGIVPKKSLTAKPINIPEEYARSFILGYYDGDGNFSKATCQTATVVIDGSEGVLEYIKKHLQKYLHFESRVAPNRSIFRLGIWGALKVQAVLDYLYNGNETLCLERKYNQYRSFVDGFTLSPYHSQFSRAMGK